MGRGSGEAAGNRIESREPRVSAAGLNRNEGNRNTGVIVAKPPINQRYRRRNVDGRGTEVEWMAIKWCGRGKGER